MHVLVSSLHTAPDSIFDDSLDVSNAFETDLIKQRLFKKEEPFRKKATPNRKTTLTNIDVCDVLESDNQTEISQKRVSKKRKTIIKSNTTSTNDDGHHTSESKVELSEKSHKQKNYYENQYNFNKR